MSWIRRAIEAIKKAFEDAWPSKSTDTVGAAPATEPRTEK